MTKQVLQLLLFIAPFALNAQYTKVNLDFESAYIGENNPLPAEEHLLFSGAIPEYVDRVELNIYPHKSNRSPLHRAAWQRPLDNQDGSYNLPVNYKLRSASNYDIEALYFKSLSPTERTQLLQRLSKRLRLFLDTKLTNEKRAIEWAEKPKRLREDMNQLLRADLNNYRTGVAAPELQLSELVALQMAKMAQLRIKDSLDQVRLGEEEALLIELIDDELARILPERIFKMADARYLEDCPTEEKQGAIAVNAGYAGVYFSGDPGEDLDYGTSPFLGLSFPLGNSAFAPRFFSNTYLGFGLFLNEFESADEKELSGPITGLPLYASLDHKLFQFVYLNLGATLLEEPGSGSRQELFVRPFIGLSAKINLSVRFER